MKIWLREWKKLDINEVADSLLVIGLLKAECFSCHEIGLSKETTVCPKCGRKFRYAGFRKKAEIRYLESITTSGLEIIDFDDFLKEFNRIKAKRFLDKY